MQVHEEQAGTAYALDGFLLPIAPERVELSAPCRLLLSCTAPVKSLQSPARVAASDEQSASNSRLAGLSLVAQLC